jgi:BolA protein
MKAEQRVEHITELLTEALQPTELKVEDEGHLHIGHAGAKTGKGHFYVAIASPLFVGQNPIACHRLIYSALGSFMQTDIHALRITIK